MPYRLTEAARQDLTRIYWHGFYTYGEAQADFYYAALIHRFDDIAAFPLKYPGVDHIRQGYRRSVCGVDHIYYRINAGMVDIMRILGRQDPDSI